MTPPSPQGTAPPADPWAELRRHTPARIALGRAGTSLPTHELLRFAADHAEARDAVWVALDGAALAGTLQAQRWATLPVHSQAPDRTAYHTIFDRTLFRAVGAVPLPLEGRKLRWPHDENDEPVAVIP